MELKVADFVIAQNPESNLKTVGKISEIKVSQIFTSTARQDNIVIFTIYALPEDLPSIFDYNYFTFYQMVDSLSILSLNS